MTTEFQDTGPDGDGGEEDKAWRLYKLEKVAQLAAEEYGVECDEI